MIDPTLNVFSRSASVNPKNAKSKLAPLSFLVLMGFVVAIKCPLFLYPRINLYTFISFAQSALDEAIG